MHFQLPENFYQECRQSDYLYLQHSDHFQDDLYHHLLNNEAWESIVDRAHDLEIPLEDTELEHTDHMLWSNKRSHKWLIEQLAAAETTGGRNIFEMVYLNKAVPDRLEF